MKTAAVQSSAGIARGLLPPVLIVGALLAYRLAMGLGPSPAAPQLGQGPCRILPRYDEPRAVTDKQLIAILDRVKPSIQPLKTNNLVHALRLWGTEADFLDPTIPSGLQMRDYFLDDRAFRQWAGPTASPLFYRDASGISVRSFDDGITERDTSSYHADDLLATLAETGTPPNAPLHLREETTTVGDLLASSLSRMHLDRLEYEWTLIVYARYVFPKRDFENRWGEKITVDDLVDKAVGARLELGACNGLHRLEALAVLYRADEHRRALSSRTREKIEQHFKRVSDLLVSSQSREGYWTRRWPEGSPPGPDKPARLYDQVLVTGHHLEWLALAPPSVQPPRETIVRAGQWLARTLLELDEAALDEAYGPVTHAARALALWRNRQPFDAWQNGTAGQSVTTEQ